MQLNQLFIYLKKFILMTIGQEKQQTLRKNVYVLQTKKNAAAAHAAADAANAAYADAAYAAYAAAIHAATHAANAAADAADAAAAAHAAHAAHAAAAAKNKLKIKIVKYGLKLIYKGV